MTDMLYLGFHDGNHNFLVDGELKSVPGSMLDLMETAGVKPGPLTVIAASTKANDAEHTNPLAALDEMFNGKTEMINFSESLIVGRHVEMFLKKLNRKRLFAEDIEKYKHLIAAVRIGRAGKQDLKTVVARISDMRTLFRAYDKNPDGVKTLFKETYNSGPNQIGKRIHVTSIVSKAKSRLDELAQKNEAVLEGM